MDSTTQSKIVICWRGATIPRRI